MSASRSRELERVEHLDRLGDRQVDVLGDRASLDAHRTALRLQPLPLAGGARAQRAVRLELLLLGPGALFVAPPQVRNHPFEVRPERILLRASLPLLGLASVGVRRRGTVKQEIADACASRRLNGSSRSMPKCGSARPAPRAPACDRPCAHGAIAPLVERQRFVRHEPRGIEVVDRAQPLAVGARAVRRVERERARRHLGHADAAVDARQPAREQPVAAVERVDDDDVVGEVERDFDRFGQPPLDAAA